MTRGGGVLPPSTAACPKNIKRQALKNMSDESDKGEHRACYSIMMGALSNCSALRFMDSYVFKQPDGGRIQHMKHAKLLL